MSLLKPPSPLETAASRGSRPGFGVRAGSRGVTDLRSQSADSTMVVSQVAQRNKPRDVELKGLTNQVFSEHWTTFSGFAGPPKRGNDDLLIQQGLSARLRWRRGECLLNLKDLLAALSPNVKRLFEGGSILRPLFWCRVVPNSAIFCQDVAECGIKSTLLATEFMRACQVLRPRIDANERRTQSGHQARKHHNRAPHAFAGRRSSISRAGRRICMLTDMVKQRE